MYRKFVCAVAMTLAVFSVGLADEFLILITKVEGNNVTFARVKLNKETKKLEQGETTILPVGVGVKVARSRFDKDTKKIIAGDPIEGGLQNELFTKLAPEGIRAIVVTDEDHRRILEIRVAQVKKKKD